MINKIGIGLFILGLNALLNAEAPSKQMPSEILLLSKRYYPDFRIIQQDDLNDGLKEWFKASHPDVCPGYVKADFNGDTKNDYAVLLIKKLYNDAYYESQVKLVIFLSSVQKSFKPFVILEKNYDVACYMYLEHIPRGTFVKETCAGKNTNKKEEVILKYSAIKVCYFECSSVVYYWNDIYKKFDEIWTSD